MEEEGFPAFTVAWSSKKGGEEEEEEISRAGSVDKSKRRSVSILEGLESFRIPGAGGSLATDSGSGSGSDSETSRNSASLDKQQEQKQEKQEKEKEGEKPKSTRRATAKTSSAPKSPKSPKSPSKSPRKSKAKAAALLPPLPPLQPMQPQSQPQPQAKQKPKSLKRNTSLGKVVRFQMENKVVRAGQASVASELEIVEASQKMSRKQHQQAAALVVANTPTVTNTDNPKKTKSSKNKQQQQLRDTMAQSDHSHNCSLKNSRRKDYNSGTPMPKKKVLRKNASLNDIHWEANNSNSTAETNSKKEQSSNSSSRGKQKSQKRRNRRHTAAAYNSAAQTSAVEEAQLMFHSFGNTSTDTEDIMSSKKDKATERHKQHSPPLQPIQEQTPAQKQFIPSHRSVDTNDTDNDRSNSTHQMQRTAHTVNSKSTATTINTTNHSNQIPIQLQMLTHNPPAQEQQSILQVQTQYQQHPETDSSEASPTPSCNRRMLLQKNFSLTQVEDDIAKRKIQQERELQLLQKYQKSHSLRDLTSEDIDLIANFVHNVQDNHNDNDVIDLEAEQDNGSDKDQQVQTSQNHNDDIMSKDTEDVTSFAMEDGNDHLQHHQSFSLLDVDIDTGRSTPVNYSQNAAISLSSESEDDNEEEEVLQPHLAPETPTTTGTSRRHPLAVLAVEDFQQDDDLENNSIPTSIRLGAPSNHVSLSTIDSWSTFNQSKASTQERKGKGKKSYSRLEMHKSLHQALHQSMADVGRVSNLDSSSQSNDPMATSLQNNHFLLGTSSRNGLPYRKYQKYTAMDDNSNQSWIRKIQSERELRDSSGKESSLARAVKSEHAPKKESSLALAVKAGHTTPKETASAPHDNSLQNESEQGDSTMRVSQQSNQQRRRGSIASSGRADPNSASASTTRRKSSHRRRGSVSNRGIMDGSSRRLMDGSSKRSGRRGSMTNKSERDRSSRRTSHRQREHNLKKNERSSQRRRTTDVDIQMGDRSERKSLRASTSRHQSASRHKESDDRTSTKAQGGLLGKSSSKGIGEHESKKGRTTRATQSLDTQTTMGTTATALQSSDQADKRGRATPSSHDHVSLLRLNSSPGELGRLGEEGLKRQKSKTKLQRAASQRKAAADTEEKERRRGRSKSKNRRQSRRSTSRQAESDCGPDGSFTDGSGLMDKSSRRRQGSKEPKRSRSQSQTKRRSSISNLKSFRGRSRSGHRRESINEKKDDEKKPVGIGVPAQVFVDGSQEHAEDESNGNQRLQPSQTMSPGHENESSASESWDIQPTQTPDENKPRRLKTRDRVFGETEEKKEPMQSGPQDHYERPLVLRTNSGISVLSFPPTDRKQKRQLEEERLRRLSSTGALSSLPSSGEPVPIPTSIVIVSDHDSYRNNVALQGDDGGSIEDNDIVFSSAAQNRWQFNDAFERSVDGSAMKELYASFGSLNGFSSHHGPTTPKARLHKSLGAIDTSFLAAASPRYNEIRESLLAVKAESEAALRDAKAAALSIDEDDEAIAANLSDERSGDDEDEVEKATPRWKLRLSTHSVLAECGDIDLGGPKPELNSGQKASKAGTKSIQKKSRELLRGLTKEKQEQDPRDRFWHVLSKAFQSVDSDSN